MKPLGIIVAYAFLIGCVGDYQLKGYHVGAMAGKNIYSSVAEGIAPGAYTTATVTTSFDFAK